jgi:hypothetical protein
VLHQASLQAVLSRLDQALADPSLHPYQLASLGEKATFLTRELTRGATRALASPRVARTVEALSRELADLEQGGHSFHRDAQRHLTRILRLLGTARHQGWMEQALAEAYHQRALEASSGSQGQAATRRTLCAIERLALESIERTKTLRAKGRLAIRV